MFIHQPWPTNPSAGFRRHSLTSDAPGDIRYICPRPLLHSPRVLPSAVSIGTTLAMMYPRSPGYNTSRQDRPKAKDLSIACPPPSRRRRLSAEGYQRAIRPHVDRSISCPAGVTRPTTNARNKGRIIPRPPPRHSSTSLFSDTLNNPPAFNTFNCVRTLPDQSANNNKKTRAGVMHAVTRAACRRRASGTILRLLHPPPSTGRAAAAAAPASAKTFRNA